MKYVKKKGELNKKNTKLLSKTIVFFTISNAISNATLTEENINQNAKDSLPDDFDYESLSQASKPFIESLKYIRLIFTGPLAIVIGSIALVTGVVLYLLSTSTDISPILRLLLKIVFALSLVTGGFSIVSGIFGSDGSTIIL